MTKHKIAIIGVGNMGQAIVSGLLRQKIVSKNNLFLSNSSKNNKKVAKGSEIIILAVKPQIIKQVLLEIKEVVPSKQLIISVAAGVKITTIKECLNKSQPVIRVMPNLCAVVSESISVWVKSKEVSQNQAKIAKQILKSFGEETQIKEEFYLNKVTAISGSGPAYVFYLVELLELSAVRIGLDKDIASKLALQTIIGSAHLLENTNKKANTLRNEVTSKGGTTEAAFEEFAKSNLNEVFLKGVKAAYKRAKELDLK